MTANPATRRQIHDHLGQAEFSLKVAGNFECLANTPAGAAVQAALAQVQRAREWVRTELEVSAHAPPFPRPLHEDYPDVRRPRISAIPPRSKPNPSCKPT
ncbi:MAG: hypothetical protein JNK23_04625 [Opitutaceae bacterium]|nr:hypothetical protein [Opitutaceae bacterium]